MYWQISDWLNGAGQKKKEAKKNTKKTMLAGKNVKTATSTSKTSSKENSAALKTVALQPKKVADSPVLKITEDASVSTAKVSASSSSETVVGKGKGKASKAKVVGTIPVRVNVYSLVKVNESIKYTGIGIYHTGTEVHNCEWAYGGHPLDKSGIFLMRKPRDLKSLSDIDGSFVFMQTLQIGFTSYSLEQVKALVN